MREAITHGETGLPVDFPDADAPTDQVIDVPANPDTCAHPDPAARAHVVGTYDFRTLCLPEHIRQMNTLVPEKLRIAVPV